MWEAAVRQAEVTDFAFKGLSKAAIQAGDRPMDGPGFREVCGRVRRG